MTESLGHSDIDPELVEVGVGVLRQCDPGYDLEDDFDLPTLAGAIIAAVAPLIRAQIADEIHARRDSTASKSSIQWNGAISCAEGIARGKRKP